MTLFHGSPYDFKEIKSPATTGIVRSGEESRTINLASIFGTTDIYVAKGYAGGTGYIYELDVSAAKDLASTRMEQGKRKPKNTQRDIWVFAETDVTIVTRWKIIPLGRNKGFSLVEDWASI